MPNSQYLELLIGQAMLSQAMLGEISSSVVEAYIEWDLATRNWDIVIKFAVGGVQSKELFDDVLSEFAVGFHNMKSAKLLAYVDSYDASLKVGDTLTSIDPLNDDRLARGFCYRRKIEEAH